MLAQTSRYNLWVRWIVGLGRHGALVVVVAAASSVAAAEEIAVEELIRQVEAAEKLYADCDVTVKMTYARSEDAPPPTVELPIVERKTGDIRCVFQNGMMHLEATVQLTCMGRDRDSSYVRTRLYDGVVTRLCEGAIVNIIDGPPADDHVFRPHTVLFQDMGYPVPLSIHMQGGAALLKSPGGKGFPADARRIECVCLGESKWESHPCVRIAIRHISTRSGKLWDEFVIWLATDRNYLPIHYVGYSYRWSSDLAYNEGSVVEFKELTPGVWFPMKTMATMYDHHTLKRDHKQVIKATRTYEVQQVSLTPNHPIEFFRDLEIPEQATVYHVDQDGEIVESYRVDKSGDRIPSPAPP